MNLILIGYRGTGKSTIGKRVATALAMPLVSLDTELVRRAGQSIPDLVAAKGWEHFRDLETELVLEFTQRKNQVIDCGGGVVEKERNYEPLRRSGTVFWLSAMPSTIAARIEDSKDRPALTQGQTFLSEVEEVLKRRTPLYARLCHVKLTTDQLTPMQVADRIISLWPKPESAPQSST
jgi:shikimate kinase